MMNPIRKTVLASITTFDPRRVLVEYLKREKELIDLREKIRAEIQKEPEVSNFTISVYPHFIRVRVHNLKAGSAALSSLEEILGVHFDPIDGWNSSWVAESFRDIPMHRKGLFAEWYKKSRAIVEVHKEFYEFLAKRFFPSITKKIVPRNKMSSWQFDLDIQGRYTFEGILKSGYKLDILFGFLCESDDQLMVALDLLEEEGLPVKEQYRSPSSIRGFRQFAWRWTPQGGPISIPTYNWDD